MKHCISIATLAEYIGNQGTANMVQAFGGASLKIPKRTSGAVWQRLLDAIGPDCAKTLVETYGGESLYVATNARALHASNRESVQALRAQGKSFAEIARSHTVTRTFTERWVRKLAATDTNPMQQLTLPLPDIHPLQSALFGRRSKQPA